MAKSEIEFAAEQAEKMTELLRNGILVAINEDNTYMYSDVVDYMIAHGATIPVRCKDCIWFSKTGYDEDNAHEEDLSLHMGWCVNWRMGTQACAFCSYGERRNDDQERN